MTVYKPIIGEYVPQLETCPFCDALPAMEGPYEKYTDTSIEAVKIACEDCGAEMEEQYDTRHWRTYQWRDQNAYDALLIRAKHVLTQRWNTRAGKK